MRDNFAPSMDCRVYYAVTTDTGVYPAFYPVGTKNSIATYKAIATWGSPPFNLPPRLTMRGVLSPLPKIFVFFCAAEMRHCYVYGTEQK